MECPEPPQPVCAPGSFTEITIDTASGTKAFSPYYLSISRVAGLDGTDDEYGVSFGPAADGSMALSTIRHRADRREELLRTRFQSVTQASAADAVPVNGLNGSVGGGAMDGEGIVVAARANGSVSGDYDLFASSFSDGGIQQPRRLSGSQVIYWEAQPAFTPDGQAIYFASDRRGGSGGTDIYVMRRQGNGWLPPTNVGIGVNTACDELSPFVSSDGQWLYFSSAGHATVGGYDLFRAPIRAGQVGSAENLGRPINTPADELFPSAPRGAQPDTLLYYSSNQSGSKGFDMYVLHRLRRAQHISGTTPRTVTLKGTVVTQDGRPIDSAIVRLEERDPPGRKDSTSTTPEGNYRFEVEEGRRYEILAGSDSTLYVREEVRIPIGDGRRLVTHDITLGDTVTFRVNFPFNNATDPYDLTLDEHGMPSDLKWTVMIDRAAEFLERFNGATGVRFEIVGHTDPVGSDAFNLDLGQRRAEFIRSELIRRGVNAELLGVYSRGEQQPLTRFANEAEELYHARLRRVELIRKRK